MAPRTRNTRTRKAATSRRSAANNRRSSALTSWFQGRGSATRTNRSTVPLAPSLVLPATKRPSSRENRAQEQARRRRRTARQMRRVESLVSRVQMPKMTTMRPALPPLQITRLHPSRIVSFLLVLFTIGAIAWVHYDLNWYVYREYVTFNELTYHDPDALYPLIDVEGWNVFWVSPRRVREQLVALPTIADAEVHISPPHSVAIDIQEAEPVALWATQEGIYWLLPDGTALDRLDERYDTLPQLIDNERDAAIWGDRTQQQVDPDVLHSGLALLQLVPGIENLYFHNEIGLNFLMPGNSTWIYWGDGSNMEQKYGNLEAVRKMLRAESQPVSVVDLRSARPVLRY